MVPRDPGWTERDTTKTPKRTPPNSAPRSVRMLPGFRTTERKALGPTNTRESESEPRPPNLTSWCPSDQSERSSIPSGCPRESLGRAPFRLVCGGCTPDSVTEPGLEVHRQLVAIGEGEVHGA